MRRKMRKPKPRGGGWIEIKDGVTRKGTIFLRVDKDGSPLTSVRKGIKCHKIYIKKQEAKRETWIRRRGGGLILGTHDTAPPPPRKGKGKVIK